MKEKFKSLMSDLKTSVKLSGSLATKLQKTFDERVVAASIKYDEGRLLI